VPEKCSKSAFTEATEKQQRSAIKNTHRLDAPSELCGHSLDEHGNLGDQLQFCRHLLDALEIARADVVAVQAPPDEVLLQLVLLLQAKNDTDDVRFQPI
jgi:hypothetical protein